MKLFNTLKKKISWSVGAVVTVASAAYPFIPPEQKLQVNIAIEIVKNIIESKEDEKNITD